MAVTEEGRGGGAELRFRQPAENRFRPEVGNQIGPEIGKNNE